MALTTILLIALILVAFSLMTKGILKQEVAMPLLALSAISLAGSADGLTALGEGFREFSRIAVIFTAVAVPAHILQRSGLLNLVGMRVGELVGSVHLKTRLSVIALVPAFGLTMVYIMAALFHNTTSILVSSVILFVICQSYKLKGIPVLCGALVASNLGGFSTRWGDTPNIVEANQWGLTHSDFFTQILPINLIALVLLICAVTLWLRFDMQRDQRKTGTRFETILAQTGFVEAQRNISLDFRLVIVGITGLAIAILGPLFSLENELSFSALAIIFCVFGDRPENRSETLLVLGVETYATLASIFVLAQVLAHSNIGIGNAIQQWLSQSGMQVWAISSASYLGTLFTEAASWASAATPIVYAQAPTHIAAWALGSGIFAGSSSLVTAASAGIILTQETKNYPEGFKVTFGSYVMFGLTFSLFILIFYILILTLLAH